MSKSAKRREITDLLVAWSAGDQAALDRLMPLVYDRLCALAASFLRREQRRRTFETGALVHEAYLRLIDQDRVRWQDRAHFFAICARLMRRILLNHARYHAYEKRGGGSEHLSIDELRDAPAELPGDVVALDEALRELAARDEQQARIVELRYFGGLNRDEIAFVLGISSASVTRRWRMARAWLYHYLIREEPLAI